MTFELLLTDSGLNLAVCREAASGRDSFNRLVGCGPLRYSGIQGFLSLSSPRLKFTVGVSHKNIDPGNAIDGAKL